jgi:hypothetical protein
MNLFPQREERRAGLLAEAERRGGRVDVAGERQPRTLRGYLAGRLSVFGVGGSNRQLTGCKRLFCKECQPDLSRSNLPD